MIFAAGIISLHLHFHGGFIFFWGPASSVYVVLELLLASSDRRIIEVFIALARLPVFVLGA